MEPLGIDLLLQAAVRASRGAAIITGALIVIDSAAVLLEYSPRVPRPKYSALAWLVAGAVVAFVGTYLVWRRALFFSDLGDRHAAIAASVFWSGLAISFTLRAIARAERPWLTFLSFALMMGFGTALAVICPL